MKITVKTAGLLSRYLPPGSVGNVADLDIGEGATPIDVMKQLGMPPEGGYLVIRNGVAVPRGERASCALAEDDVLAIVPPLKGG